MGAIHMLQDCEEKPECMCSFHRGCFNSMYFHTYFCLIGIFCSLFSSWLPCLPTFTAEFAFSEFYVLGFSKWLEAVDFQ